MVLAGCGGGERREAVVRPALPADVAGELARRSDDVAARLEAGDRCGALAAAQELRARAVDAVNAGRVPAPLQEELLGAVNALAGRISCTPPPAPAAAEDEGDAGHGKGKAKGKRKKKEKDD